MFESDLQHAVPCRAAPGAADLERALREDRRPLAGMFRVQVMAQKGSRHVVHDGIRICSGTLGVTSGMQTILREGRGANFSALGPILVLGRHWEILGDLGI